MISLIEKQIEQFCEEVYGEYNIDYDKMIANIQITYIDEKM